MKKTSKKTVVNHDHLKNNDEKINKDHDTNNSHSKNKNQANDFENETSKPVKKPKKHLEAHNHKSAKKDKHQTMIATLQAENASLQKQIINLQSQNLAAKIENQKNINDFQLKAKEFQTKAQAEIDKIKETLNQKLLIEKNEIEKYTLQKFLESILQPFSYLLNAINFGNNSDDANVKAYVVGFTLYIDQLLEEFSNFGIHQIKPQIGEKFNEQIHKILKTIDGHEKNVIIEVQQPGFKLYDHVLIPALVVVGQ